MTNEFVFYDLETAPEESKNLLGDLFDKNGRNGFYSVLAGSPETFRPILSCMSYLCIQALLMKNVL